MSNTFSQKESVYAATKAYLSENNVKHEDGQRVALSKEGRRTVIQMVTTAAMAGEMELSAEAQAKYDTTEKMSGYVNGLVSNWLRKDIRLNGGEAYEPKNPGSRAGQGDELIKNLRNFRKTLTEEGHKQAVDKEIAKRQLEIQASKAKKVEIQIDLLPESLRGFVK